MATIGSSTAWNPTRLVDGGSTSFVADDAALPLLDELTEGACGLGDPVSFDAEKFVLAAYSVSDSRTTTHS